tara:strand:- start:877 stop:1449 length:573 start_codon:yes stop_codon:yes gene_type:complete
MYGFIYITTNHVNGKRYLGMCRYGKPNWKNYLGSGKALKRAIIKYGQESFTRDIVCKADTKEDLSNKEIELISQFKCVKSSDWYNIADGGYTTRGFLGKKHTDERNKVVADKLRGRKRPSHIGEAVRKAHLGTVRSAETRKKHSESITGEKHHRAKSVIIDGVKYATITEAHKVTGISKYTIRKHLDSVN